MTIDTSRTSDLQFGNLGHHVQAGAFKPDLARMEVTDYVYGLPIQIQWIATKFIFRHLEAASGMDQ